jgi:hypothetical protein
MDKYPVLAFIVRYGMPVAIALAVVTAALTLWIGFPLIGWASIIVAAVAGGVLLLVALSYVELVRLITEMLLPQ